MNYEKVFLFLTRLWKKEPIVENPDEVFPLYSYDTIVMTEESLPKIKAGMFWFSDNTFSEELISDKSVRAIVLGVYGNRIIGWLLDETSLNCYSGRRYSEYKTKVLYNGNNVKLIQRVPNLDDLLETFANYRMLCEACRMIHVPDFIGFYWSWEKGKPYLRYAPKSGERSAPFKDSGAKVRWILEAQLK